MKNRELIHQVNKGKVNLKRVYSLIINRPIKNRMYKQSEWVHDNFYSEELNGVAHLYMDDPKRN